MTLIANECYTEIARLFTSARRWLSIDLHDYVHEDIARIGTLNSRLANLGYPKIDIPKEFERYVITCLTE